MSSEDRPQKSENNNNNNNAAISVLMPPQNQVGGLIKMPKKNNPEATEHTFKVPAAPGTANRGSLLGLDKLAAARRKEKEQQNNEESKFEELLTKYKILD